MSRTTLFCALLLAAGQAAAQLPEGAHEVTLGDDRSGSTIRIRCLAEGLCEMQVTMRVAGEKPDVERYRYKATPLANRHDVDTAWRYARERRDLPESRLPDDREGMRLLKPVLEANPALQDCWAFDRPEPGYFALCTLSPPQPGGVGLAFFATRLTDRCEAFCRYLILPLRREP